jgi:hypothetical protein
MPVDATAFVIKLEYTYNPNIIKLFEYNAAFIAASFCATLEIVQGITVFATLYVSEYGGILLKLVVIYFQFDSGTIPNDLNIGYACNKYNPESFVGDVPDATRALK